MQQTCPIRACDERSTRQIQSERTVFVYLQVGAYVYHRNRCSWTLFSRYTDNPALILRDGDAHS